MTRSQTNYLARPLLMLAAWLAAPAFAITFIAPRAAAVPGGVVTFKLAGAPDQKPVVTYGDRSVLIARQGDGWLAVLGVGLDTEPGEYHVSVKQPGAAPRELTFTVAQKQYSVQQLKVAPGQVNLSAENEARVASEQEKVRSALAGFTPQSPATLRLAQPVPGRRSSSFGLRRVFNGESRR